MVRIIAGKYKNVRLDVPKSARPLTDRIKLSIFDLISDYIKDANVLDLFSGSGSFGLEALSRGAKSCAFVEKDTCASTIIKSNVKKCEDAISFCKIHNVDVKKFIKESPKNILYNIIFVDPPFTKLEGKTSIDFISNVLDPNGLLVLRIPNAKTNKYIKVNAKNYDLLFKNTYGICKVFFYKLKI